MRKTFLVGCLVATVGWCSAQEAGDRIEFSGLTSPCDESSLEQATTISGMSDINDDIASQIADLEARVNDELVTYGDTSNECSSTYCTIGGGQDNQIDSQATFGFIRGGKANWCYLSSPYCAVGGGQSNVATGDYCSLGGGIKNKCYSNFGSIGGGFQNVANARFATVVGGSKNTANGRYALAMGYKAVATADYSASISLFEDSGCSVDSENTIKICGDSFVINNVDFSSVMANARVLESTNCKSVDTEADQRLEAYEAAVATLIKLLK